jgi:aspartokinase
MVTVSKVVERIVKSNPSLEIMLSKDLISYSKLARYIKKEVREEMGKEVNDSAIIVAVKRLQERAGRVYQKPEVFSAKSMTTYSHLMEIVVLTSSNLPHKIPKVYAFPEIDEGSFLNISESKTQTTFLFSESMEGEIKKLLEGERVLIERKGISLISIAFCREMAETPGFTVYVLKELAWNGINLVEVLTTYTELNIIIESKVLTKTYKILEGVLFA